MHIFKALIESQLACCKDLANCRSKKIQLPTRSKSFSLLSASELPTTFYNFGCKPLGEHLTSNITPPCAYNLPTEKDTYILLNLKTILQFYVTYRSYKY